MKLFGKKKEEDEDALIERLTGSSNPETAAKEASGKRGGSADASAEKLGAQISAIREVISAHQERFERQSEEIGELRSALAERERQMRDVEAKAVKAADLVSEVQPEALATEQKKTDAKLDALRAKLENGESVSSSIIEELKKVKGSIAVFRGTESLVSLNKEIQEELKNIKKVEATVERHADRVEALFSSFETNFGEFEKMKDGVKDASETCSALKKEVEKNSAAIQTIPKKDEFYNIKDATTKALEELKAEKAAWEKKNVAIEAAFSKITAKKNDLDELMEEIDGALDEIRKERASREKKGAVMDAATAKVTEKNKELALLMETLEKTLEEIRAEKAAQNKRNAVIGRIVQKNEELAGLRGALEKTLEEIKIEKAAWKKGNAATDAAVAKAMEKMNATDLKIKELQIASFGNSRKADELAVVIERMAKVIARGGKCSRQR